MNADRPPHVCLLSCSHVPNDVRVTHKVGMAFRQAAFRVSWVGPEAPQSGDSYGIEFHFYKRGRGKLGRLMHYRQLRRLAATIPNVDVWYGVEPDSGRVAAQLANQLGGRSVLEIHEMYDDEMLNRWVSGIAKGVAARIVRRGIRRVCSAVDLVIGVGITRLEPYRSVATTQMVIRNCSPLNFAIDPFKAPFDPEKPRIRIMHGKGSNSHGTHVAIEAVGLAQPRVSLPIELVIFRRYQLDGLPGMTEERLLEFAETVGARNNVLLMDQIPYGHMPDLLMSCDIGMILYAREYGVNCTPNRIFEFMAVGRPVIVPSYAVELKDIVMREQFGELVDCEDPHAVADAIVRLANNTRNSRNLAVHAREAFLKRHNWEIEVQNVIDWIRNGMDNRSQTMLS